MNNKKIIALCASVSFYKELFEIENNLKEMGYKVLIPKTARRMQRTGDFDVLKHKTWFQNSAEYKKKKALMDDHFKKIINSNAILVVNNKKNGLNGYIGGNVLMEITVAYMKKLPIYLWNDIGEENPFEEEIRAMRCVILNRNLSKIKLRR
jgi:hypothetical protein